jgi:hypothetical protein
VTEREIEGENDREVERLRGSKGTRSEKRNTQMNKNTFINIGGMFRNATEMVYVMIFLKVKPDQ